MGKGIKLHTSRKSFSQRLSRVLGINKVKIRINQRLDLRTMVMMRDRTRQIKNITNHYTISKGTLASYNELKHSFALRKHHTSRKLLQETVRENIVLE